MDLEVRNEFMGKNLELVLHLQHFSLKKNYTIKYQISKVGLSSQAEGEHLIFACLS